MAVMRGPAVLQTLVRLARCGVDERRILSVEKLRADHEGVEVLRAAEEGVEVIHAADADAPISTKAARDTESHRWWWRRELGIFAFIYIY